MGGPFDPPPPPPSSLDVRGLSSTIVRVEYHVESASCSTTEVAVLHNCGATWFQMSSFSQASLVPYSVLMRHIFIQSSANQIWLAFAKHD